MERHSFEELMRECLEGGNPAESNESTGDPRSRRLRICRALLDLLPEVDLEPVPTSLARSARGIAISGAGGGARDPFTWIARLVGAPAGPAPAVRGSRPSMQSFEAGPYELNVSLLPGRSMVGQLLVAEDADVEDLPDLSDAECVLYGDDRLHAERLGEDGDFRIAGVLGGVYDLAIEVGDDLVIARGIDLR